MLQLWKPTQHKLWSQGYSKVLDPWENPPDTKRWSQHYSKVLNPWENPLDTELWSQHYSKVLDPMQLFDLCLQSEWQVRGARLFHIGVNLNNKGSTIINNEGLVLINKGLLPSPHLSVLCVELYQQIYE